jgi:hypothetical protein
MQAVNIYLNPCLSRRLTLSLSLCLSISLASSLSLSLFLFLSLSLSRIVERAEVKLPLMPLWESSYHALEKSRADRFEVRVFRF